MQQNKWRCRIHGKSSENCFRICVGSEILVYSGWGVIRHRPHPAIELGEDLRHRGDLWEKLLRQPLSLLPHQRSECSSAGVSDMMWRNGLNGIAS